MKSSGVARAALGSAVSGHFASDAYGSKAARVYQLGRQTVQGRPVCWVQKWCEYKTGYGHGPSLASDWYLVSSVMTEHHTPWSWGCCRKGGTLTITRNHKHPLFRHVCRRPGPSTEINSRGRRNVASHKAIEYFLWRPSSGRHTCTKVFGSIMAYWHFVFMVYKC